MAMGYWLITSNRSVIKRFAEKITNANNSSNIFLMIMAFLLVHVIKNNRYYKIEKNLKKKKLEKY